MVVRYPTCQEPSPGGCTPKIFSFDPLGEGVFGEPIASQTKIRSLVGRGEEIKGAAPPYLASARHVSFPIV